MSSLRKQLDTLINPTPAQVDPGEADDFDDGTSSRRILEYARDGDGNDATEIGERRIRQAIDLGDDDAKYAGKKATRSELFGNDNGFTLNGRHASDGDDDENESEKDDELVDKTWDFGSRDEDEKPEAESDLETEEESENEKPTDDEEEGGKNGIVTMNDDSSQDEKGAAVRAQLELWDKIMHLTIKSHAALRFFNQLPRGELAQTLTKDAEPTTRVKLADARRNIFDALGELTDAVDVLGLGGGDSKGSDGMDEEITSSEDEDDDDAKSNDGAEGDDDEDEAEDEDEEDKKDTVAKTNGQTPKKPSLQRLSAYQKRLQSLEKANRKPQNEILSKWDERTRLVTRKINDKSLTSTESTIVRQIDKILSDKYRLLRRTQTRRSEHIRIGGPKETTLDSEIYDDDDFYQILLREFIDHKSSKTMDPVEMSRQAIELQRLREKRVKRVTQGRTTKGRKLRFVTIPKLVNFYPSHAEPDSWPEEKRNELFKSLFQ